jgi:hypothetical protein
MFKNASVFQIGVYACAAVLMLFTIISTAAKIYETETRPPGHECKAGESKPATRDSLGMYCDRGYWEAIPPVVVWDGK